MPWNPIAVAALRFVAFIAGLAGAVAGLAWCYVGAQFRQCANLECTAGGSWPGLLLIAALAITVFIASALAFNFALRGHLEQRVSS